MASDNVGFFPSSHTGILVLTFEIESHMTFYLLISIPLLKQFVSYYGWHVDYTPIASHYYVIFSDHPFSHGGHIVPSHSAADFDSYFQHEASRIS